MRNILLIDDDEIIQKVLQKILQQHGYNVVVAIDGKDGVEKMSIMKFSLIITDIMMPYLNGFELIEQLKIHPNTDGAKIVVISSITHQSSIDISIDLGVDLYVSKPLVIDNFVTAIKQILP